MRKVKGVLANEVVEVMVNGSPMYVRRCEFVFNGITDANGSTLDVLIRCRRPAGHEPPHSREAG